MSAAGPGGGLSQLLAGSDAESMLVSGILDHHLQMDSAALRAAVFLQAYGCADLLELILGLRRYQSSMKPLVQATEAIALKRFMGQVNINLGGK